jgi:hypothetical protein
MFQSDSFSCLVWNIVLFQLKIINYNCSGHKFNIFLKYFGSVFKTELSVICSLWNNIFCKKFHRHYVLNLSTFEIVCAQYKRGSSSLYLISFDMSIYYRMFWCRCLHSRFRHWSIALSYQISMTVTGWKIINCSLSVECELSLLFFRCKQF